MNSKFSYPIERAFSTPLTLKRQSSRVLVKVTPCCSVVRSSSAGVVAVASLSSVYHGVSVSSTVESRTFLSPELSSAVRTAE